jgi:hypothetical protein
MAYEISNYSVKVTLVAGADLSALQYTFVKLNSSGEAVVVRQLSLYQIQLNMFLEFM